MNKRILMTIFVPIIGAVVVGCGGGGGGGAAGGQANLTPTTISGKVVDGYVGGATVCLDLNANNLCDSGEPTATTDASGSYSFNYAGSITGLHVLAQVPTTATDSDTGQVTTGYSLLAPAESPSIVSALTTFVSNAMKTNPSFTATQAESSVLVSNNIPANSILGVDVTTNATLHQISAAATQAIAQTSKTLLNTQSFATAVNSSAVSSVGGQAVAQGVIAAQTNVLGMMQNPDGSINSSYLTGSNANNSAVTSIVNTYVTNNLSGINASTSVGASSQVSMQSAMQSGLYFFHTSPGGFYMANGTTPTDATFKHFVVGGFSQYGEVMLDQTSNWRSVLNYIYELTANGWVSDSSPAAPTFNNNCFSSLQATGGATITACAVAHDISNLPISTFGFNCNDANGNPINGCNTSATFPNGSVGYDMVITYNTDQYQVYVSPSSTGTATTGTNDINGLISNLSTSGNYNSQDSNCQIVISVASYNQSSQTGVMNWYYNNGNSCSSVNTTTPSETSNFYVTTKGGAQVLVFNLTSTYMQNHTPGTNFGTFQTIGNINSNSAGVYPGNLYKTNTTTYFYFGQGANFMNATAMNFLLSKYSLPAL